MVTLILVSVLSLCFAFLIGKFIFPEKKENVEKIFELERAKAIADGEKCVLEERLKTQESDLLKVREQMRLEFESVATKLFDSNTQKFEQKTEKNLETLLSPFKDRLQELQKTVSETYNNESRERFALKNEIERIVEESKRMTLETGNLTKALKGDNKAQGSWGEITLERILERSGLRKGEEYIVQSEGMGLKNEEGRHQRPDVVVIVPTEKHIIVDSKVVLTSYIRYIEAEDANGKALHLKSFISAVYAHIDGLSAKDYQHNEKLVSPDFVMLFMPIEGAFSLAVQTDPDIFSYAWNKKITLVCPSTLLATLKTVASLWRFENQNKNALEIARQAGALYDRFVGLMNDLIVIGDQIEKSGKIHAQAMDKLKNGRGNLISRVEKLKDLGAKASKNIPSQLLTDEESEF